MMKACTKVAAWAWSLSSSLAFAAPTQPSPSQAADAMVAFPSGAVLVAFDPAGANQVWMASTLAAPTDTWARRLTEPTLYSQAVPSFEKADVRETRRRGLFVDQRVEWELEIPLWNLGGELWIKPFDNAVQLRLTRDAFSPGNFLWRWAGTEKQSTLTLEGTANARDANWGTRQLAKRNPLAEAAMTVAAAYTMFSGMMALAVPDTATRWPQAAMEPGDNVSYAQRLVQARRLLKVPGPLGIVVRQPNGRLDHVEIALPAGRPASSLIALLADPLRWRALPGWKRISASTPVAAKAPQARPYAQRWMVDATFPFLDFDAQWDVSVAHTVNAVAVEGDAKGALWSWHVIAADPHNSVAVFSSYPRIDRLGYMPRKFIEKEPLLEQGLALALAYVNAASLVTAIGAGP